MKKIYSYLIFTVIISMKLDAQWVSNTTLNTVVNDDATYGETVPISAPGLNGATYVSWFQGNTSGSYDAMLQLLDVNGVPVWSTPLVVSNQPQQSALYNSDFTTDHAGNALMAFQDIRNGNLQTVIYKISPAGAFLWGSNGIMLHDAAATFEAAPRVAVFDNDDVVVAWSASAGSNKWIAWQKFDINGNALFTVPQVIDDANFNYSRVVPVVSAGNFLLVYVQETGSFPGLTSVLFCNQYNSNGMALWPNPAQVSAYTLGFVSIPVVASDNTGGCFIGFNSGTPGAPSVNDAFVQRINAMGATVFGANGIELSAMSGNHKFIKDMYYHTTDMKLYCTLKITDSGQNGAGVYAQAISATGTILYAPNGMAVIPISTAAPCEPYTIKDAGVGYYLTYTEGGFNSQTLKAHKIAYPGTFLFNTPLVLSDAVSGKSRLTSAVDTSSYQVVVSWEDSRINQGIYAQNMNNDGSLGVITGINSTKKLPGQVCSVINTNEGSIMVNMEQNGTIKIFNTSGQLLLSQPLQRGDNRIASDTLANGIYFYEVSYTGGLQSGKMVQLK